MHTDPRWMGDHVVQTRSRSSLEPEWCGGAGRAVLGIGAGSSGSVSPGSKGSEACGPDRKARTRSGDMLPVSLLREPGEEKETDQIGKFDRLYVHDVVHICVCTHCQKFRTAFMTKANPTPAGKQPECRARSGTL